MPGGRGERPRVMVPPSFLPSLKRNRLIGWTALFCALTGAAALAQATAEVPPGVMERPRPDYDATGISIGDWLLLPSLGAAASYDNNVFRSLLSNRTPSDWFLETVPAVRLQRKTEGAVIGVFGNVDDFRYARFHQLNLTDWTVGADGRVASADNTLRAAASGYYGKYHESFESAEVTRDSQQTSQTRYYRGHLDSALAYDPGQWRFGLSAALDSFDWQPATLLDDQGHRTTRDNRNRDESIAEESVRAGYQVSKEFQIFARGIFNSRDFRHPESAKLDRSSSGYRLQGGAAIDIAKTLKGELFLGYLRQNFAGVPKSPLPDFAALDYGVDLNWYVAPELTVHFTAGRSLSDVILPGVSTSNDQFVRLGADYELAENVILQGYGAYTHSHFVGRSRTDEYPSAGATLRYLIDQHVSAQLSYLYSARSSNAVSVNFADEIISAGIVLHL